MPRQLLAEQREPSTALRESSVLITLATQSAPITLPDHCPADHVRKFESYLVAHMVEIARTM
ncbi:hypothetical protein DB30_06678 [Enhygromyxa salina]|uniref:Uncharacterized protein n=1 Tax=Enhygromyxa salina TaxID=215803 RepID=A0A0C2CXZ9_9BACT|nr:hypothetical protein [Enhygromyxa salina]KIG14530.1 hypothetical protein DB30_06678 [Enhygromyxa salina]